MFENKFIKADRMQKATLSVIAKLSEKAQMMKNQGKDVINLCTGEPDFNTPEHVKLAAQSAMANEDTKYPATSGTKSLKKAIIDKLKRDYNLTIPAEEILVSNGAKQLLFNALFASLNLGDEVIVPAPYWTSYTDMIGLCGGLSNVVHGSEHNGFKITPEQLEANISPATRWLLLNSPSNPTGAVYSKHELKALATVLKKHPQVWIMADEIYEHLTYDENSFESFCTVVPELAARTLIINGVSKAYAMTGWRVGYAFGPQALIKAMTAVQSQSTSGVCTIAQAAATAALNGPQTLLLERRQAFKQRRNWVVNYINSINGLSCNYPDGAFYIFANCSEYFGTLTPDRKEISTDVDYCDYLLQAAQVAVVPGSAFGASNYIRLSYAASMTDLAQACRHIKEASEALKHCAAVA